MTCTIRYHKHISEFIEPNEKLKSELEKYIHLLDGVTVGLHVRRGLFSPDCLPEETSEFVDDENVQKFILLSKMHTPVFVASDSRELKDTAFRNCRKVDLPISPIFSNDKLGTFIDFLLIGKCQRVVCSSSKHVSEKAGNISTFGYAAAAFGQATVEFFS